MAPWNDSSQDRDNQLILAGKITVHKPTDLILTLTGVINRSIHVVWAPSKNPIFAEIYCAPDNLKTSDAIKDARLHLATLFLEEELCQIFAHVGVSASPASIRKLVACYIEIYPNNNLLPAGLVLDIDQVLPETTRRHDWGERRKSILTLNPLERMRLKGRK